MVSLERVGIVVGHATDAEGGTGLTVVRAPSGALRAGVAVLGRATGTRELALLEPGALVDRVDAILLTGGSAYGLDAAAGVMRWMEERGRGFPVPTGVVPIVPAAVLFDLAPRGRPDARPSAAMAWDACERAGFTPAEGRVGAGTGATVGKAAGNEHCMDGGVGVALREAGDAGVAALAVVNAFGDVVNAEGRIIAGARDGTGRWLDARALIAGRRAAPALVGTNTTLAVVATDQPLGRTALTALARAACAALTRRIVPAGTILDGDVVFAVAPATVPPPAADPGESLRLQMLAVEALELAIERAVTIT